MWVFAFHPPTPHRHVPVFGVPRLRPPRRHGDARPWSAAPERAQQKSRVQIVRPTQWTQGFRADRLGCGAIHFHVRSRESRPVSVELYTVSEVRLLWIRRPKQHQALDPTTRGHGSVPLPSHPRGHVEQVFGLSVSLSRWHWHPKMS